LRALVISGCVSATPDGIELLVATHPTLQRLDVAGCIGLGGTVLSFVAERGPRMVRLPNIDDSSIARFASACPKLEELHLSDSPMVTGACLETFGRSPPGAFPSLTELRLNSCVSVDDAGLLVILGACPRIQTLSLSGSGVSQEALVQA
ncbi:unnamed protein product, partial [Laminaria digitata]